MLSLISQHISHAARPSMPSTYVPVGRLGFIPPRPPPLGSSIPRPITPLVTVPMPAHVTQNAPVPTHLTDLVALLQIMGESILNNMKDSTNRGTQSKASKIAKTTYKFNGVGDARRYLKVF